MDPDSVMFGIIRRYVIPLLGGQTRYRLLSEQLECDSYTFGRPENLLEFVDMY